ncbi:acyl-CoA carboxylase epsilon subunit [Branchiibius sp. NY16-3462-2]|uniref:acyl-CoA carboxylase epsilon subunit n=1 Tax=Branchiibius sp. NY16-3462-2 TaxID=1807500 RepID=UPI0025C4E5A8|nr:acyl-CoA carboxylase epsilon subunit [Branchiibius sp. NY16-3462-2]
MSAMLKVISGNPTPEELAALVAVLAASRPPVGKPEPRSRWSGRSPWAARSWRGR